MIKIHFLLVKAAVEALFEIFENDKQADKIIEKVLKSNPKWGSRDRAFIAETVYDCVRWQRLYAHLASPVSEAKNPNPNVYWEIVGVYLTLKNERNIALDVFQHIDFQQLTEKKAAITERKILYAIPDWLDETGEKELGAEAWTRELEALNQPAQIILRVNPLKIKVLDLQKKLADLGWASDTFGENLDLQDPTNWGLILKKRGNITATDLFQKGYFEVQDGGSQLIAPFLEVEPNMRVIDACAGAGGKTLHLATIMRNKGNIIALDTEGWKLKNLETRALRNGIKIIENQVITSEKTIESLHNSADRLLLDVPCSGLGVLKRNPDTKWKLKPDFLDQIRDTQQDILTRYSKMVKRGGKMVYATCSILPSENERQVQFFLEKNPNWAFVKERKVLPSVEGFDGFYMALMERKV